MPYQMNEAETKLVAALRSGTYRQAHGALKNDEGYCCLGVACDVLRVDPQWTPVYDAHNKPTGTYGVDPSDPNDSQYFLDDTTAAMLGWQREGQLWDTDGSALHGRSGILTLARANDHGCTFEQIAQLIEHGLAQKPVA